MLLFEYKKNDQTVEIVQYSEKAIAVFGDTKPIKNELKSINGRYNNRLKIENELASGWIFSNKRMEEVTTLLNGLNFTEVEEKPIEEQNNLF